VGKHFLFTSMPGHGHVNPTLPLVEELVRRGHRVSYGTNETFTAAVEAAGATAFPTKGTLPTQLHDLRVDRRQLVQHIGKRIDTFLEMIRADFPILLAHAEQDPPDAVCFGMMSGAGRMLAEKMHLPGIAHVPTFASNEHFSLRGEFVKDFGAGRFAKGFDPAKNPELRQAIRKMQDFAAEQGVRQPGLFDAEPAPLNIVFVPREFQVAGDTFDERFRFVGPMLGRRVVEDQWQPPATGKPLLFVSLGTAFNNRPEFFRQCLEAFGDGEWNVAIAVGERIERDSLGRVPDNVEIRPYFPQLEVLRHADVFLSHTGMNSTMESLAAAVPLVAVPQMPEQELNARRVEELGLGRKLDTAGITTELLRSAVAEVSADNGVRANVAAMSEAMKAAGGAVAAADAIEAYVG
jgi:MGT family glycosyltransferase